MVVASASWGKIVTVIFTPGTDTGETSVTKDNVTAVMSTMNNASYYQIYANSSGTFSCTTGKITKIEFACTASGTSKYGPGNSSANVGTYNYSGNTGTWTGEATSVTISSTAQVRMSSLSITYTVSDGPINPNVSFEKEAIEFVLGKSTTITNPISKPDDLTVAYESNKTDVATVNASTGEVIGNNRGEATITAKWNEVEGIYNSGSASYKVIVREATAQELALLYESWSKSSATNDGTSELYVTSSNLDYNNWKVFSKVYQGAGQCGKLGTSSAIGKMTTNEIALTGNGTLTFKIKKYGSDDGKLKVSVTGAAIVGGSGGSQFSPTSTDEWTDCTINLVNGNGKVTIVLETTSKRMYIDDIMLLEAPTYTIDVVSNNTSYGSVVMENNVITATPAEGYRLATPAYRVTSGEAEVEQDENTFIVTAKSDCQVQINFEAIPTHTVTFSVNGTETSKSFAEGSNITFDTPDDVQGKKFVGWTTATIDGTTDECPELVTLGTMGNADVKYYAVYAKKSSGDATQVIDVLNRTTTGITGTSYSTWYGKTDNSDAVYAGQSAGGNESIQLRSKDSNSGVITTASGGKLKKVVVVWNNGTESGRTLDVYGSNTAYESAADLYAANTQGTKLGSIVYDGTSTELTITGDYAFIGLRSNNGALYLDNITITWESGTPASYSDYCTTVVAPVKPAKPIVFHDGGEGVTYEGELTVPMFAEEGATIYYTTDGSEPTTESTPYTEPLKINDTTNPTTVKAIAVKNGVPSDVVEKVYTIVPVQAPDIVDLDGYYSIQNYKGNYVNVAGRKTVTFVEDNSDKAGTVIKVKTTNGEVDVLRSQGVDVPGYAERAMNYVDDIISLAVEKLELQNLLGSTGEQTILEKFHDAFDYHLHLEQPAENKYRIYGKTPSMKHVVDFYAENKDKVDAKLPMMEERINYAINKVLEKVGRGLSLKDQFNIHRIWDDMNVEGLTEPVEGDDAAIARFYEEVLSSEAKVWLFAYEAAMYYVNFVEGKESFLKLKAQYPEYFKYWDKAKRVLPDFKYYIVSNTEGNGIDFISEGNEDIKNNAERTIWTLGQREKFKVSLGVSTTKTVYPVSQDGTVESYTEFYTTLNTDFAYTLPEDVTAYQITGVGEVKDNETMGTVLKQAITGTIPAQTPVLLMAKEKTAELQLAADASALSGNELYGNEYLIEKDQLKHTMMKTVFETIKKNFGDELYDRYVAEYEHLMLLNSGTVNNKYFFNLSKANDLAESGSYIVGKVMVLGQDDDLGIRFHYANKEDLIGNEAFMFDDTNKLDDIVLTLRGDINRDGIVSIADVTALVNIILGKAKYPDDADKYDFEAANVNGDQVISIADVTALVNIIQGKDKAN